MLGFIEPNTCNKEVVGSKSPAPKGHASATVSPTHCALCHDDETHHPL